MFSHRSLPKSLNTVRGGFRIGLRNDLANLQMRSCFSFSLFFNIPFKKPYMFLDT